MQHCIGAAMLSKSCGQGCAVYAGWLEELRQNDFDKMDLDNNKEGAQCGNANDLVACCEEKLRNNKLNTKGNCE